MRQSISTYERIARAQGLGPVIDGLEAAGIAWAMWQSGGYTMVLTASLAGGAFLGVALDPPQGFNVCRYERDREHEGGEVLLGADMTAEDVVAMIQARLALEGP